MQSELTFQYGCATPLETFEWDRIWLEHTENTTLPRVLYIGDSISCGVLPAANKLAVGKLLFDGYHTSKALDNPHLRPTICAVAAQQARRDMILFNNGFHGWHLDDEQEYSPLLADTLAFLQKTFPDTPLAFVQTSHAARQAWQARGKRRTELAAEVAQHMNIPLIDFYTPTLEHTHLIKDGVHLFGEGYDMLAGILVRRVTEILEI